MGGAPARPQKTIRMEFVQTLLAQCKPYHVVVKEVAARFGVEDRRAKWYIAETRKFNKRNPVLDLDSKREELTVQVQTFYNHCMAKGAYSSAGRALRELGLLWGVYAQPSGYGNSRGPGSAGSESYDDVDVGTTDPDRIRARMADLMTKHEDAIKQGAVNHAQKLALVPDVGVK